MLLLLIVLPLTCYLMWLLSKLWRLSRRKDRLLSARGAVRRSAPPVRSRRRKYRKE
ncbi:high mobility group protein Z [Martelella alba]|uniref:High mobility group protein Z n=1 Tax=Martelella alba TaxID=2590451 RepID=A0ABY2SGK9_9HYPH|nr:high mobility group protein Z [Martelella alba]